VTDFILLGVREPGSDDHRYALLPSRHNPRRALLQSVMLTSNNQRIHDFVLVGAVKDLPCSNSVEAQAAWLRNLRRLRPFFDKTTYPIGIVISSQKRTRQDCTKSTSSLVIDYQSSNKFCGQPSINCESTRGRKKCQKGRQPDATAELRPGGTTTCTAWVFYEEVKRVDTPIPSRRAVTKKQEPRQRDERSSNDSVMSLL